MKNNYKPKAKNEIALKTYIKEDAIKKSNNGDNGSSDSKRIRSRNNNIR